MHLFDARLVLLASFLTSSTSHAERRSEETPSSARPSSLRLPAFLIISFPLIRSILLAFLCFYLSRGLTQIPWITQTRWLKPSGITTGKRNPVLGIRLLYLPIMVVICPGKHSHTVLPVFFHCFVTKKRRVYLKCVRSPPSFCTRPHVRLYASLTFFFTLL